MGKRKGAGQRRDRRRETLFIDARTLGTLVDRVHRELTDADVEKIADTYHAWRGDKGAKGKYADVPGFCKSATTDKIAAHGHVLPLAATSAPRKSRMTAGWALSPNSPPCRPRNCKV